MKKVIGLALLFCLLFAAGMALAEGYSEIILDDIELATVFPPGWTVVTPGSVAEHFHFFMEATPEVAAAVLRSEGVYAVAFSQAGDAMLRVIATEGDADAAVYYDIERYTPAMRTAIRNDFLDREAWALTGYRYTEAEWTNKTGRGRLLNLTYSIRQQDEVVARGLQAYTIHAGRAYTLDLQVRGRHPSSEERRVFEDFVAQTAFPAPAGMPLLPVGLTLIRPLPEETHVEKITVRGQTMQGATVAAWLQPLGEKPMEAGELKAGADGAFRVDVILPHEGEYRLHLIASCEGYAECEDACWISFDTKRIPINFISYPEGEVLDPQVVISGKTIRGVTVVCEEGETKKTAVTPVDGEFSFKLDRAIVGDRTVTLTFLRDGYMSRQMILSFNRQWRMEDYIKYLSDKVQNLSYAHLYENPQKYAGRQVRYAGHVVSVSEADGRGYVQLALAKTKDGAWTDSIIAVADGMNIALSPGDSATLYVTVTGETYTFSVADDEGEGIDLDLPAVELMAYQRTG
ncbi:MAG: hypothetical protein FWF69_06960 [Firmicutes bacterium]|nr:hypothetical protein [Bacillota bacterium]